MNKIEIRELMRFFDKSNITTVKIKDGEFSIELKKGIDNSTPLVVSNVAVPQSQESEQIVPIQTTQTTKKDTLNPANSIKSPMVGTFYIAPSPGSEPFVKVGAVIQKGEPVAVIEAMKIMNEIEAEFTCKIKEVLIEDGAPVEFDMPLFVVERV